VGAVEGKGRGGGGLQTGLFHMCSFPDPFARLVRLGRPHPFLNYVTGEKKHLLSDEINFEPAKLATIIALFCSFVPELKVVPVHYASEMTASCGKSFSMDQL